VASRDIQTLSRELGITTNRWSLIVRPRTALRPTAVAPFFLVQSLVGFLLSRLALESSYRRGAGVGSSHLSRTATEGEHANPHQRAEAAFHKRARSSRNAPGRNRTGARGLGLARCSAEAPANRRIFPTLLSRCGVIAPVRAIADLRAVRDPTANIRPPKQWSSSITSQRSGASGSAAEIAPKPVATLERVMKGQYGCSTEIRSRARTTRGARARYRDCARRSSTCSSRPVGCTNTIALQIMRFRRMTGFVRPTASPSLKTPGVRYTSPCRPSFLEQRPPLHVGAASAVLGARVPPAAAPVQRPNAARMLAAEAALPSSVVIPSSCSVVRSSE